MGAGRENKCILIFWKGDLVKTSLLSGKAACWAGSAAALHIGAAQSLSRATSGIKALARGFNNNLPSQRYVCIRAYLVASLRNRTRGNLGGHQILPLQVDMSSNPFNIV